MIPIGFLAFSITSIPSVITRPFVINNSKEKTRRTAYQMRPPYVIHVTLHEVSEILLIELFCLAARRHYLVDSPSIRRELSEVFHN